MLVIIKLGQSFRKRWVKRMDIRDLLDKANRKLLKVCSDAPDCLLISNIIPKKKETKYHLRNETALISCLEIYSQTDRCKNVCK